MNRFGKRLSEHRKRAIHPTKKRLLSQGDLADLLALEEGTDSYSASTVSNWETGRHNIDHTQRDLLIAILRVLHRHGGLHSRTEADALLLAGDYRPLNDEEVASISPAFVEGETSRAAATMAGLEPGPPALPTAVQARLRWSHIQVLLGAALVVLLALVVGILLLRPDRPPATQLTPRNPDFEEGELAPWQVKGDPACAEVIHDPAWAHQGRYFLRIDARQRECISIRYDLHNRPIVGSTFRFAWYVRATTPGVQHVGTVIWVGKHPLEVGGVDLNQKASAEHWVSHEAWRCVEVALPIVRDDIDVVRAELYLPPDQPTQIAIDGAQVSAADQPLCALQPPQVVDGGFEESAERIAWRFLSRPCNWQVFDEEGLAQQGQRFLRVSNDDPDCRSLYQDVRTKPLAGVSYSASAWLRTAGDQPARVGLVLHALGGDAVTDGKEVYLLGEEWRCVDVRLPVRDERHEHLRIEFYLNSPAITVDMDNVAVAVGDGAFCPPQELLINPDFEWGEAAGGWRQHNDRCDVTSPVDETLAYAGQRRAVVLKTPTCHSLFQDIAESPNAGGAATFSVWARSEQPVRGRLTVWGISADPEQAELRYFLPPARWTCLQTTLTVNKPRHDHWRAEIYFDTPDAAYELDAASFQLGHKAGCPQRDYRVSEFELLPGQVAYAGATVTARLVVENDGDDDPDDGYGSIWLAEQRDGEPVHGEAITSVRIPALVAGQSSGPRYVDLVLPTELRPGQTYFIRLEVGGPARAAGGSDLPYLPLRIEPCDLTALFCDAPAGYWAQVEVETWYAERITNGCRSGIEPYHGLSFCVGQALWPEVMAIFLLRQRYGANFPLTNDYRGLYADVPETYPRARWIEALHDHLGTTVRSNCSQPDSAHHFCLDEPVLRAELLRMVAQTWPAPQTPENTPVTTLYADLIDDPELAAIAGQFYALGILPEVDPHCPGQGQARFFCPDEPARRAAGLVEVTPRREQP